MSILSDICFICGQNRIIVYGHRKILRARAPLFEQILKELYVLELVEIDLPNQDPYPYRIFILYLYSQKLPAACRHDFNFTTEVLRLGLLYQVGDLVEKCMEILMARLSTHSMLLFETGCFFGLESMMDKALEYLQEYAEIIFQRVDFIHANETTLIVLMSMDKLKIRETTLFKCLMRWAHEKCRSQGLPQTPLNHRVFLKNLICYVRFPIMTAGDFLQVVAPTNVLTQDEFQFFWRNMISHNIPFNTTARSPLAKHVILSQKPTHASTKFVEHPKYYSAHLKRVVKSIKKSANKNARRSAILLPN